MGIPFQYGFVVESAHKKKNLKGNIDCIDKKLTWLLKKGNLLYKSAIESQLRMKLMWDT